MSKPTTYRVTPHGDVVVHRALGDAFRALRAAHPGARRQMLKSFARKFPRFHCYPAPAWAHRVGDVCRLGGERVERVS